MLDRLGDQHPALLARGLDAEQAEEGRLARILILAQLLAGEFLVALHVH